MSQRAPRRKMPQRSVDSTSDQINRNGQWEFLGDCTHEMAGRTAPMIPPDPEVETMVPNDRPPRRLRRRA